MFPIFGLYNLPRYLLLKGAAEEAMKIWSELTVSKKIVHRQSGNRNFNKVFEKEHELHQTYACHE